ncbi:hypothetical protein NE237_030559 [Protea cynaroides]|uniref:Glycosyl transferase CAP10 domain-containing protein n=1 Tax=Protea cynaroides TaxID=273540 RepID=A0A9Q0GXF7_9MAGN|nr:hypothetical protein NE237_030559 [Protea cynaroides]
MRSENTRRFLSVFSVVPDQAYKHLSETIWPVLKKGPVKIIILFLLLLVPALVAARLTNTSIKDVVMLRTFLPSNSKTFKQSGQRLQFPLNCSNLNLTKSCSASFPAKSGSHQINHNRSSSSSGEKCPHYFKWIHENLKPWKDRGGITRKMVERARHTANFRLVIVNGTVYVERYSPAFQTRDVFTWWGILQLMKRYPGKLPDLDLMFDCDDQPVIKSDDYKGLFSSAPPPLFRYCADDSTLDIIFPDWSFWGWPEVNIKPWVPLSKQLREGNKMMKWSKREPYAYWKGNPYTSQHRQELMKCNPSHNHDWKVRAYNQDWGLESREGFKNSDLAKQCIHRYKIYVEGRGWSVSDKYILACNSMTLVVKPRYYDFFSRSLMPLKHYWPIKEDHEMCRSIKLAVDWGNTHKKEAQDIGNAGSKFVFEELKIDYVVNGLPCNWVGEAVHDGDDGDGRDKPNRGESKFCSSQSNQWNQWKRNSIRQKLSENRWSAGKICRNTDDLLGESDTTSSDLLEKVELQIRGSWVSSLSLERDNMRENWHTGKLTEKGPARTILIFVFLFVAAFICAHWIDTSIDGAKWKTILNSKKQEIQLECSTIKQTKSCPAISPVSFKITDDRNSSCPDYFRWIHEDLRPWKTTGITKEMVERAKSGADFRLVIVKGRVYIEQYRKSFQTRDLFTWWGILQLLRKYPGRLPDLDLMFHCGDRPVIRASDYQQPKATPPPPLFQYCGNDGSLGMVFPDWSFWGWPEINIKPWETLSKELKEANERSRWIQREPYAFWKGNPSTSKSRQDLMKCNPTDKQDWKVRAYTQDWNKETQQGFKQSDLAKQCKDRYKIYVEGRGWSVSQKYILACDSMTLLVKPQYYDFTTRSLIPMYHYWPIRDNDICRAIKFAVDWGNIYKQEAQGIGRAASNFIEEELKMDYVYDYMFNLLNEYAKLMKYKPTIPEHATEFCSETMACPANGLVKKFMMDSMVKFPADTTPCAMPPPFDPQALQAFLKEKEATLKQVEAMEKKS